MSEHEEGKYIRVVDSESSFNSEVNTIMESKFAQSNAFVEPRILDFDKNKKRYYLDINKCRKNIL